MTKIRSWLSTAELAAALGITPRRLRDLRKQGLFQLGKHYRIVSGPQSGRPTYQWHRDRCERALEIPMEQREEPS
ncbi:helix-turn-helix domain-containing protein [Oculatella sp. LEGE 06141]|uniref:helix-turn-helix domain-containing protein n=1 Tax=Oculatella sp. LEGE 06141 TaxID=1828648 RepID=UPI0018829C54|nr:helix-turn-helix domain-containing protein [Oculatella sp. LEGE 06141]MBE9182893.1 helix-turn-helix domain-containing protein [Oculatella sp. LEGE 06141]